jgi:N-acetylmuramoyl-L-alanine amidase
MGIWYTIAEGDCLWSIGEREGIAWKKIWLDSNNSELRSARANPNVLYPGDRIFIPDREERKLGVGTEKRHRFRSPREDFEVRIILRDVAHKPMSAVEYHFSVDGEAGESRQTGDDGVASETIRRQARDVELHLPWGVFPVRLGVLDPANSVRGIQQRLLNLGIDPGPIDGIWGPLTKKAVVSFQEAESETLKMTGEPDAETIRHLRSLHDADAAGSTELLEQRLQEDDEDLGDDFDVAESLADRLEDELAPVDDDELTDGGELWDEADVFDDDAPFDEDEY